MGKTENFIQASFTKDKIIPQILISISVGQIFRTVCKCFLQRQCYTPIITSENGNIGL